MPLPMQEYNMQQCDTCIMQKRLLPSRTHLEGYLVGAPMEQVTVDVLGLFPVTDRGNHYVIVVMDYFTKWP